MSVQLSPLDVGLVLWRTHLGTATNNTSQGGPGSSQSTFQELASSIITSVDIRMADAKEYLDYPPNQPENPGVEDIKNIVARRNVMISDMKIPIVGSSLTAAGYEHRPTVSLPASLSPSQHLADGDVGSKTIRGDGDDP
ncbi:uncharacterized protein LAESUDRAFT_712964 [Laetiporus sulphureus 93-53]|uniref:Uncharacterized protein n=1 Tax=Laetiporus sulphureus 93-53 TaxID=1314785 RepID=A0A165F646_9APHY|nr:uncharacterized protein LAESUDRAFT_712964 [Laetiporus sulphureus 93-53]KZT08466.1 hypothetical protein LAESUDRAFT_712964 [Laetiporus sulphureus 93-53]